MNLPTSTHGVATGDLHCTPWADFSRNIGPDGLTPVGHSLLKTVRWLVSLTKGCNGDFPWILNNGDYTNSPGFLDSATLFLLSKLEEIWADLPDKILSLGNHDINEKVGLHNLALHTNIPGYYIPKYNTVLRHHTGLYVVPFTYSVEEQIKLLRSIPDGSVVAVHTPIQGAALNPSMDEESGVPASEFERFSFTLAGHYHTPQVLQSSGRTIFHSPPQPFVALPASILILGTPLAHSFSDTGTTYGAWVVDLSTNLLTFHENPHSPRYQHLVVESLDQINWSMFHSNGNAFYVSLTAPQTLHKEILARGLPGVTAFRLRRPPTEVPKRGQVVVPPLGEGGSNFLSTLLSYLDSTGQSYDRDIVEEDISKELGLLPSRVGALGGRVQFLCLKISNFLSYNEAQLDFQTKGLWLISGINKDTETAISNGAGKTNLLEAIIWCIYGDTLREAPSKDSVVRKDEKICQVEVEFEVNEKVYKISRGRNRNTSKTVVALWAFASGIWTDISACSVSETNKQILKVLGIQFNDFLLTTFFGSYLDEKFTELKDGEKKQFLCRVYELGTFDSMFDKYKEKLCRSSQSLSSMELNLEEEKKKRQVLNDHYEQKRISVEREIVERAESIATAEIELEGTQKSRDAVGEKITEIREILEKLQEVSNKRIEAEIRLESIVSGLAERQAVCQDTQMTWAHPPSVCSACGQFLPESIKHDYVEKLLSNYSKSQSIYAALENEKIIWEQHLLTLPRVESLAQYKSSLTELERLNLQLSSTIATLREKIRLFRSLPNPSEKLQELRVHLQTSEDMIEDLCGRIMIQKQERDLYSFLLNALGPRGVVSYVLDRAVGQINSYLEYVSETLYSGDYSVWLASTKELKDGRDSNVITLQYSTPGGDFGLSSGGEKRKAEIALFMAINYLLSSQGRGTTNLVIFDEALDSLDSRAASSTVESIRRFVAEEGKTGFLISHSEGVKALVDRQIVIERHNEVSRICQWSPTRI